MAVIDSRNRNGDKVIVNLSPEDAAKLQLTPEQIVKLKDEPKPTWNGSAKIKPKGVRKPRKSSGKTEKPKAEKVIVPAFDMEHVPTHIKYNEVIRSQNPNGDPSKWDQYSKGVNTSVAGLGCSRQIKGKPYLLEVMRWTDPVTASDTAVKKAGVKAARSVVVDTL